ncbi:MAG: murein biosynthesis integral membrane protein MurJ [Gemmatimonadota bacterium]
MIHRSTTRSAVSVGAGILLSRLAGYVRDLAIAFFFGTSLAADAYAAALRIPNVLRNLLGEGTLSASFVPVYSALLGEEDGSAASAQRLARGVLTIMLGLAGLLAGLGILFAPLLTRVVAPGFGPEGKELTTELVRILFPMAGVMILAAWSLGVLTSHRRFFLPFAAPVLWNGAQIVGLLLGARFGWPSLVHVLAWSTLVGSLLQLGVQLPTARRLVGRLGPVIAWSWEPVRRVFRNMVPVVAGQGIFQLSSFLEVVLASLLPGGAVAGLYYAQRVAYLPLSLFGVSVATASLPEMSRHTGADALRGRLVAGFDQILYFVLPSCVALILFGDLIVRALFQRGAFDAESAQLVSWILAAYALGLVASSSVKLFASGFHAMQDTRTPMRFAIVGVGLGILTGAVLMLWLRSAGFGAASAAGLTLGGAAGAWLNLGLLWHGLGSRIGPLFDRSSVERVLRLAAASGIGGAAGFLARAGLAAGFGEAALAPRLAVLAGTLFAAGVAYVWIAGRPPAPSDPSPRNDSA